MSDNEQKPEPNSTQSNNGQPVPKIDFGISQNTEADPDAAKNEDAKADKDSDVKKESQPENKTRDQDSQPDPAADAKQQAEPKGEEQSIKKLQSTMEARFEQQLAVNRRLAAMLEEQLDLLFNVRQSMLAIQKTLESSAATKKKLEAALETVKDGSEGLPDAHWINRVRGTLAMLQRSGMV